MTGTTNAAPTVLVDRSPTGVAIVRLNRPDRLNALVPDMVDLFTTTIRTLGDDREVRVIVITGSGRAFSAGLDIGALVGRDHSQRTSVDRFDNQERFARMIKSVRAVDQPVIAAVNGPAAGAALGIALAADVRFASESARFLVGSVKIGLSAGECGISWHLPRLIGTSRAMEIMLTGRPIDATEAERIGLVTSVVPDADLLATALASAEAIAANSPFAVRMTKRVAWSNLEVGFDTAIELENRTQIVAVTTNDSKEAMAAFTEKRPPVFDGT